MRRKKITACILVAVLLIGALYIVQRLLVPKYQTGIVEGSMVEEYYKDRSDHEVLFVGDCEVYENFSTIELWNNKLHQRKCTAINMAVILFIRGCLET